MKTEVTNEQFRMCADKYQCDIPVHNDRWDNPEFAQHPVTNVTLNDVVDFIRWADNEIYDNSQVRLPSGEEWTKSCLGPNGWKYAYFRNSPSSDIITMVFNVQQSGILTTTEVTGTLTTTEVLSSEDLPLPGDKNYSYGAFHMLGNVAEWVSKPERNPFGGSFKYDLGDCSYNFGNDRPASYSGPSDHFGFRLVLIPGE
jgi:formylglycine-generating enzyme required for sulfatase activity